MKSEKLIGDKQPDKIKTSMRLPVLDDDKNKSCNFYGYDVESLMKETAELRKIITKRGTLEILIPLCCSTDPVRYLTFKNSMKGFSSKTLTARLRELEKKEF